MSTTASTAQATAQPTALPAILPAPIAAYIEATNAFDLDALTDVFTDDAFVNDARREFAGKDAIRQWLAAELVGAKVTMQVTAASEHYGVLTVDAVMDGEYDKTGLPDPLVLTHYVTSYGDRIARLLIIHNVTDNEPAEG